MRFQVLFHSPSGVLFTFPSRYWVRYRSLEVFSLGGWSPLIPTGFHVSHGTRGRRPESPPFRLQGFYPLRRGVPAVFG